MLEQLCDDKLFNRPENLFRKFEKRNFFGGGKSTLNVPASNTDATHSAVSREETR